MNKKYVVMFGGSFNPPTNAHFRLATSLADIYLDVRKVVFMPVGDNYSYKGKENASAKYRKLMLESVCVNHKAFEVSDIEIEAKKLLTTYETLQRLESEYPNYELAFLIGSDNLKDFDNWSNAYELVSNYKIWVMPRNGDDVDGILDNLEVIDDNNRGNIQTIIDEVQTNLSSTFVREQIVKRRSLKFLIPDSVINVIKKYQVYDYMKPNE